MEADEEPAEAPLARPPLIKRIWVTTTDVVHETIQRLKSAKTWGRARWVGFGHRGQHWLIGIVVGLVIEFVLDLGGGSAFLIGAKNLAMDAVLLHRARAGASAPQGSETPQISFIDVDEPTWRSPSWGTPYRAPRDRVAQLVSYALTHGAKIVVVDILFDKTTQDLVTKAVLSSDQVLLTILSKLAPDKTVIFTRSVRRSLYPTDDPKHDVAPVLAPSQLDGLTSTGTLIGAEAEFPIDRDSQVRSWNLWKPVCAPDHDGAAMGHWQVMPSAQLAVVARLRGKPGMPPPPWLGDRQFGRCAADETSIGEPSLNSRGAANRAVIEWLKDSKVLDGWAPEGPTDADHFTQWRRFDSSSRIFYTAAGNDSGDGNGIVKRISALDLLLKSSVAGMSVGADAEARSKQSQQLAPVVVIGQSYDAAGDKWATPLGPMPGAIILANAIVSLEKPGPVEEPSLMIEWTLRLVQAVIVAGIFARWSSLNVIVPAGVVVIGVMIWLNRLCLDHGIWIDFAVPTIGIYLHRVEGQLSAALFHKSAGGHG